ncbi:hypothetical protein AACH06_05645 [Ideonella sp. DXS29W]|uniref:Outer membrane protein assembly factor BamE n=1 Tax=Ideonella lacteola TaxID=2984193 RepID=A0ABU9BKL7_9BURK
MRFHFAVPVALALAGCASLRYAPADLPAGASMQQVQSQLGEPTGRYPRPEGGERLEFARGPYGRHTYMVDLDAGGRVLQWTQVLREDVFNEVAPGLSASDLRYKLGRPAKQFGIWRGATVWAWRYETPFCQWFMVTVEPSGVVRDAGYGPDPICEVNEKEETR